MEELTQAATWHALHARVQRIELALIRVRLDSAPSAPRIAPTQFRLVE